HARRPRVLERSLADERLNECEVRDARDAEAAAEEEPGGEVGRKRSEQPPPAGRDREKRNDPDDCLVDARRPRIDHRQVAVRVGEAGGGHDASSTIPAATVSLEASSIRMNAPVGGLRRYVSTTSGSARRRRTTARSLSRSRSGEGRSSSVSISTTETSSTTTARELRAVCLTARRAPGSSGRSLIQQ